MKGKKVNGLYTLNKKIGSTNLSMDNSNAIKWHKRFGHIREKRPQ